MIERTGQASGDVLAGAGRPAGLSGLRLDTHRAVFFLFVLAVLAPAFTVSSSVRIPWVTFLAPVLMMLAIRQPLSRTMLPVISLWLALFASLLLSILWGGIARGAFSLGELSLYVIKFAVFLYFLQAGFKGWLSPGLFIKGVVVYLLFSALVSALQWLPLGFEWLSALYTIGDEQLLQTTYDLLFRRVPSTAHHVTAAGGIAVFAFCTGLAFLVSRKLLIGLLLAFSAVLIAVTAQSKAAFIVLPVIILSFLLIGISTDRDMLRRQKKVRLFMAASLLLILPYAIFSFVDYFGYQAERFGALMVQVDSGENRAGQMFWALGKILEAPDNFLLGITNVGRSRYEGMYVEFEPVNIFLLYGLFGFCLQYGFSGYILYFIFKSSRKYSMHLSGDGRLISAAAWMSLLFYQLFSFAYFFFRDVYATYMILALIAYAFGYLKQIHRQVDSACAVS